MHWQNTNLPQHFFMQGGELNRRHNNETFFQIMVNTEDKLNFHTLILNCLDYIKTYIVYRFVYTLT